MLLLDDCFLEKVRINLPRTIAVDWITPITWKSDITHPEPFIPDKIPPLNQIQGGLVLRGVRMTTQSTFSFTIMVGPTCQPRKACTQESCRAWHTAWLLAPPCILSHRLGPPSRSHQPTAWGRCSPRHGLAPCWGGEPRWLRGNDVWHQLAARCVQRRRCFTWCWLFAQVLGSTADSCCVAATLNPTELCPACALRCRRRCSFLSAREIGEEKGKLGNLTICHF